MPEGQQPEADNAEQFEPVWVRPASALTEHAAGRFFMIFPTIRTLERIQHHTSVQSGPGRLRRHRRCPVCQLPACRTGVGKKSRHMEPEPEFGELELVCPDGQMLHPLDWDSQRPLNLLKNVQPAPDRPNPGVMTGPGTPTATWWATHHRPHRHRPRPGRPRAHRATVAGSGRTHPGHRLHPLPPRPFARCPAASASPVRQQHRCG